MMAPTHSSYPDPLPILETIEPRTLLSSAVGTVMMPYDGYLSAGVYDADGQLVRALLAHSQQQAGPVSLVWDGKDDFGRLVLQNGTYSWRALASNVLATDDGWVGDSLVNPAVTYSDGEFQEAPEFATQVAVDADGNLYILSQWEEGPSLTKFAQDGSPIWRQGCVFGTSLTVAGDYVYASWRDGDNRNYIARFRTSDGSGVPFATNMYIIVNAAAYDPRRPGQDNYDRETQRLRQANLGMAVSGSRLFVSNYRFNRVEVYDNTTGLKLSEFSLNKPMGIVMDPQDPNAIWVSHNSDRVSRYAFTVNGQGVYTFTEDVPRRISGLADPQGVTVGGSNNHLFVVETTTATIREYDISGSAPTPAGLEVFGSLHRGGPITDSEFYFPFSASIAVDSDGILNVNDIQRIQRFYTEADPGAGIAAGDLYQSILGEWAGAPMDTYGYTADNKHFILDAGMEYEVDPMYSGGPREGWLGDGSWRLVGRYYTDGGQVRRTLMDGSTPREFVFSINAYGTATAYALEPSGVRLSAIVGANWRNFDNNDFTHGGQYNWTDSDGDGQIDWDDQDPNADNGEMTWYVPLGQAPHLRGRPGWVDNEGNVWQIDSAGSIVKVPLQGFDAIGNPLYDWDDQVVVVPFQDDEFDFAPNSFRVAANGDLYVLGEVPGFRGYGAVHGGGVIAHFDSTGKRLTMTKTPDYNLAAVASDDGAADPEFFFAGTGTGFQHIVYMFSEDGLLVTTGMPGAETAYRGAWIDHAFGLHAFTNPETGQIYIYGEEVYYGRSERYRIENLDSIQRQEGTFDYTVPADPSTHLGFQGNLNDSSGSIGGTFYGGTAFYGTGVIGQGIDLDGNDDHVQIMSPIGARAYTVSAWVKATDVTSVNVLGRSDAPGNRSVQIRINAAGKFEHSTNTGIEQVVTGTTTVQAGTWYHVAILAQSNGQMRLFVNGQEEGTARTVSALWTGGDRFDIGGGSIATNGFGFFDGLVDDVRIFEAPLSSAQIAALYSNVPTITAVASDASATEQGASTATFTITRTNGSGNLTVYYTVGGSAVPGADYVRLAGSVVIPSGQMSATVTVTPIDDAVSDINDTVTLALTSSNAYVVSQTLSTATAVITDNDIQSFTTNPGWTSVGNTINGNNYGYRSTSNAGGAAGEIGGTFARNSSKSFYADTNLSQPFTLGSTMVANGKFTLFGQSNADGTWMLGHMSFEAGNDAFLGIEFAEAGPTSVRWRARTGHPNLGGAESDYQTLPNGDYNFEYSYDPHANDFGELTVRIWNATYDLTVVKGMGADSTGCEVFDAFGIGIRHGETIDDDPSKTVQFFIDDVNYTGRRPSSTPDTAVSGQWKLDNDLANSAAPGSATFSGGTPSYGSGILGGAIDLDGSNDYVDLGNGASGNAYTVMAWVKASDTTWTSVLGRSKSGMSQQLRINAQGKFEHLTTYAGSDKILTGTTSVQADTWYHVAISVATNGVTRLYVNGQQEAQSTAKPIGALWGAGDSFRVGQASGAAGFLDGMIDDIRTYDRALAASDVQAIFGEIATAVSVVASDLTAAEHGANTGTFVITRRNSVGDLIVNYSVGGTATNGSDYSALASSVLIPDGRTSAEITVTPIDDVLIETKEAVVLTLASGSGYTLGGPRTATVTIADNDPTVTVIATDANASEAGADTGAFTISRNNTIGSLTVNYVINGMAVGGADYTALSGSVVIPAGQASAPVTVIPMDNQYAEGNEEVILTLNLGNGYVIGAARRAVVTIADDDTLPADVDFSSDPGWTGVGNMTNGNYYHYSGGTSFAGGAAGEIGGTFARNDGESYYADTNLAGTFSLNSTISASGKLTIFGQVYPDGEWFVGHLSSSLSDNSILGVELQDLGNNAVRVNARVGMPGTGGADSDQTILPNGDYNFEYTYDPSIGNGRLTVHIFNGSFDQTLLANLSGSERASGASFDAFGMGIRAGYTSGDDPGLTAQTYIDDVTYTGRFESPQTVTVSASDDIATEPNNTGTFTITRDGSAAGLVVHYTMSGTASAGSDYSTLSGSVLIPEGQTSATVTVTPIDDDGIESSESVILTIFDSGNYQAGTPGSATVTIADNDPSVTVTVTDAAASEPGVDTGTFTITRNNAAGDVTVNYTIGGTATSGSDYVALSGSVVIPDGQTSATVTVTPIDNGASESTETVILTLSAGSGYSVVSPASASVMIEDDDGTTPDVTFSTDPGWVGNGNVIGPPGNNYGYSSGTSYAGGTAGEAGGTFARNDGESNYADTNLARAYNLNDVITARGKLTVFGQAATDGNWFVGHLSSGTSDRSMIGISFKEAGPTSVQFMARMEVPSGGGPESGFFNLPNGDYNFEYAYDPTIGWGRLTIRIYNLSYDQTAVANFSFGERNSGSTFNAFGLGITTGLNGSDGPTQTIQSYIDDVAYTGFVRAGDGFEGGTSGGSGWSGSWVLGGGAAIVGTGVPNTGSNHLRLTGNGASASRAINMAGVSPARLVLDWKADNFEPGETALVEIYSSTGWVTVLTISDGQDDNAYHHADIDLSAYSLTSTFQVRFTSLMSDATDLFYIDDVMIVR